MLVLVGLLSLFLFGAKKKYFWYLVCSSLFCFRFLMFFYMRCFDWWGVDAFFLYDFMSSRLVGLTFWVRGLILLANWGVKLFKSFEGSFVMLVVFLNFVLFRRFFLGGFFLFYVFFELSLVPTFLLVLG